MRRKAFEIPVVLLAMMGVTLSLSWSEPAQKSPDKTTVEVTYYYLPG